MIVQVLDRLASVVTAISDNAVTSAQRFACGDLGDNLKDLGDVYAVFGVDCRRIGGFGAGDGA